MPRKTFIPTPPRVTMVWEVLEASKDCGDHTVTAACRRIIVARRRGMKQSHCDWTLIESFAEGM